MPDITPEVRDNPERSRFELWVGDDLAGFLLYQEDARDVLQLVHTEIHPRFEGQGLASALIRTVLDTMRERGRQILPVCPFVKAYLHKHPEYVDLVPENRRRAFELPETTGRT
jgi:predicted GNAT family acetyltransferase